MWRSAPEVGACAGYYRGMEHRCETCAFRRKAEANPTSLLSRLWRWHKKWCPGWRAYQRRLAEQREAAQR